ncbi:MAG: LysR family transcriptional regulator [Actinomycetota bacterium]
MDLQQLRYVVEVADAASFTRAAERCFVTQSALSHQIAALEREIGQRLFARTSRRVRLTEAGEAFVPHARAALTAADRARDEAAAAVGEVTGTLRLGVIPTVTAVDVPQLIRGYRAEHPRSRVELRVGNSGDLVTAIRSGELDVALLGLRDTVAPEGVDSRVLARERLTAVIAADHPLSHRRRLRLRDIAAETFTDFPSGTAGREQTDVAFSEAGLTRDVAFEASSAELIVGLVRAGVAVALLPPGLRDTVGAGVSFVSVADGPVRVEHVAWDRSAPRAAARAFVGLLEPSLDDRS